MGLQMKTIDNFNKENQENISLDPISNLNFKSSQEVQKTIHITQNNYIIYDNKRVELKHFLMEEFT